MRYLLVASLLVGSVSPARAQVSIGVGIAVPSIQIGINVPVYPELVQVPGYPVYYDPRASANFFFYDGAYWVYQRDGWYVSTWYDGPWHAVGPEHVPLYVLRVPVRYYRVPPPYFRTWRADAPPRWGERWGHDWEHQHRGWDRWDRRAVPPPAPLPAYQRAYAGGRYPREVEHQHSIQAEQYRYRPREPVTRAHFEPRGEPGRGEVRGPPPPRGNDHWRGSPPPPPRPAPPPPQQQRGRGNQGHDNQGNDDHDRRHGDDDRDHRHGR